MATDDCTLSPDGNWGTTCCRRHDRRYENKRITKYQADKLLYRCIKRKSGSKFIASVYFVGVTLFGHYAYYKATKPKTLEPTEV